MGDLTKDFSRHEFTCHGPECAGQLNLPYTRIEVVSVCQLVRDFLGKPLRINRGVSCPAHNRAVGGERDSRHLPEHADAVDFDVDNAYQAFEIVHALILVRDKALRGDPNVPSMAANMTFRVYTGHVHVDFRPGGCRFLASPGC